jgi:ribonuclease HI
LALQEIKRQHIDRSYSKIVIFVDSQSVLQCIQNCKFHESGTLTFIDNTLINLHRRNVTVKFQWVPSHVGIYGNEMADNLANEGSEMTQQSIDIKFTTAKINIDKVMKSALSAHHENECKDKIWESLKIDRIKSK